MLDEIDQEDEPQLTDSECPIVAQCGSGCLVHGVVHGQEAERLRAGIEALLKREGQDRWAWEASLELAELRQGLRRLLDDVDAGDSLAHLESGDRSG